MRNHNIASRMVLSQNDAPEGYIMKSAMVVSLFCIIFECGSIIWFGNWHFRRSPRIYKLKQWLKIGFLLSCFIAAYFE